MGTAIPPDRDSRPELATAVPVDGAAAAKPTSVDATAADTRAKAWEAQAASKPRALLNAIYALGPDRKLHHTFQTVVDLLDHEKTDKKDKHAAAKSLLLIVTEKWGVVDDTEHGRHWISMEYIKSFYTMLQKYFQYFEGIVEADWRNEMLRRMAEECLKPFEIITPEDSESVGMAEHLFEGIDLAEEINKTVPIKDIEKRKQKGVAIIAGILGQNTSVDYYDPESKHPGNNIDIANLAAKHGITLPSKKEVWEREVKIEIDKVSGKLDEKERKLAKDEEVFELGKLENLINDLEQLLQKAAGEVEGLALPAGAMSTESIIAGLRERLEKISTQNILLKIKQYVKWLNEALESGDVDRITRGVSHFLDSMWQLHGGVAFDVAEIVTKLEEMREKEKRGIRDLAAEISADPNTAKGKGEELVRSGEILNKINFAIRDMEKRGRELLEAKAAPAEATGRNFLKVLASLPKDVGSVDPSKAMQVGDYIEMTRARARNKLGQKLDEGKDENEIVRLVLTGILDNGDIEVKVGETKGQIHGTLFYNYGKTFPH